MMNLRNMTNDELYSLYGQIIAELARRQSAVTFAPIMPSPSPFPPWDVTSRTDMQPAKPFAEVYCQ